MLRSVMLSVVMLSAVMLSAVMLRVVILIAVILSVKQTVFQLFGAVVVHSTHHPEVKGLRPADASGTERRK